MAWLWLPLLRRRQLHAAVVAASLPKTGHPLQSQHYQASVHRAYPITETLLGHGAADIFSKVYLEPQVPLNCSSSSIMGLSPRRAKSNDHPSTPALPDLSSFHFLSILHPARHQRVGPQVPSSSQRQEGQASCPAELLFLNFHPERQPVKSTSPPSIMEASALRKEEEVLLTACPPGSPKIKIRVDHLTEPLPDGLLVPLRMSK